MNDYKLELIRRKPINYNGLLFYPIEFGYICDDIGLENFDRLLMPFVINKDCLDISEEEFDKINLFNDVLLRDENMLISMAYVLQLFCKCEDIRLSDTSLVLLLSDNKEFVIDNSNFEDIAAIIRLINGKDTIKVEKPPKNMSERQRDVWQKLQEGRKREAKKNEVHIYDMLNVCEFGGGYRISQEELSHMTLWQISNCYKARTNMKTYEDNLKICLVSGEGKSISGENHWHHKLMIRD